MARVEASLAVTDAYRTHLLGLRQEVARRAAVAWGALDPSDLRSSFARWHDATGAILAGAKRNAAISSDAYLAAFTGSELAKNVRPRGIDPEPYMTTSDGRSIEQALAPPLFTVLLAIKQGQGEQRGFHLGLLRATRIVSNEVFDTSRRSLTDLMVDSDVIEGWRRATEGSNPCGACLALATDDTHDPDQPLPSHWHCRCVSEPVVKRVDQHFQRPTGRDIFDSWTPAQQAATLGAEKADLVRSGAVPLSALIEREPQAVMPDQYTEASLESLRSQVH